MSLTVSDSIKFTERVQHYEIGNDIKLYTRIIAGAKDGKTAIFIHGGGSGGNHTMLIRPAKWLIEQGLFSKVILPDRRGEGFSSPLTQMFSIKEHAMDMKKLLDTLEINENITAMGISYGGPISIELSGLDSRVDEVILMASSPSLKEVKGIQGFLYRTKLLDKIVRNFYKKNLGRSPAEYPDFESVYDLKDNKELTKLFTIAIRKTDSKMLESLMLQNASTLNPINSGVSPDIKLDIPLFQIIGSKDEIWETNLEKYKNQFPKTKIFIVEGQNHKGVLLNAELFYEGLKEIYT